VTTPTSQSVPSSPVGLHRVLEPAGALPQAALRLDDRPAIAADEVRVAVRRLNLDAASFRQLATKHGGDGEEVRREVLEIVAARGKMQNPVTGSGGMLVGVVDEVGPESTLGLAVGDRVATLVSLSLTPLRITDGLAGWDGRSEQVPAEGHAILFGRSVAAVLPDDLPDELAMAVLDVCGAPALTERVVRGYDGGGGRGGRQERVALPDRCPPGGGVADRRRGALRRGGGAAAGGRARRRRGGRRRA
jgi:L-erythro-3,5-diaminohexanoate dehydrogenase